MRLELPFDCLPIILRWLDDDYATLYNACLVSRGWSLIGVSHLYKDPWSLIPQNSPYNQESKLRIAMLLRTHLSCTDLNGFNTEEKLRLSKIDTICIPPVDYLTKIVMFLQRLVTQIGSEESIDSLAATRYSCYNHQRPLYSYLSLARTVNLVRLQESLRVINATSKPAWCNNYTMEEALLDQKITQKLWEIFRNRNLETIRKLVWRGMVPLKDIFLDTKLSGLQELELLWRYDPTNSPCTQDIHLKTICQSPRNFQKISLHLDPWVEKIEDSDIATLIAAQEAGSLKSLHIEGAHTPLTETIDALLTHHQHSLREFHIIDYIPSRNGFEKIGQFSNLRSLKFYDCFNLSDKEFLTIFQACKNLQELHLCKLPYVSCSSVRKIIEVSGSNLRKLVINQVGNETIDSETVHSMTRFANNLKHLDIRKMIFPAGEICDFIKSSPQLEYIALGEPIANTPSCGDFVVQTVVQNCSKLKHLYVFDLVITEKALSHITENFIMRRVTLPVFVS
ncbi:hypothetical protein K7432_000849 [Basidiobolus ranarum]|uniref:F-box domain-containing protein n=1 Tax=Basidiobolus ranarum TaxID=34480 RepID=A0ABR2WAL6_9FUNG